MDKMLDLWFLPAGLDHRFRNLLRITDGIVEYFNLNVILLYITLFKLAEILNNREPEWKFAIKKISQVSVQPFKFNPQRDCSAAYRDQKAALSFFTPRSQKQCLDFFF